MSKARQQSATRKAMRIATGAQNEKKKISNYAPKKKRTLLRRIVNNLRKKFN